MPGEPEANCRMEVTQRVLSQRSAWWSLVGVFLSLINTPSAALSQHLPPGGTTTWIIEAPEEIVTFVLFDPKTPGISLPSGLQFVSARDAGMPEIGEHLKQFPDHAGWAFSIIEITREKTFSIDGRVPELPPNAGIGLWFAPVDPSQLREEIRTDLFDSIIAPSVGAVLGLGVWVPDRKYVSYMRERGHHAEYGHVTLIQDSTGAFLGEITLDSLRVTCVATPQGEVQVDSSSGTQVLFSPGEKVMGAVVIAGGMANNRLCDAKWSKSGNHPLAHGVLLGPTFMTSYDAGLRGSAYRLREATKQK